jgi:SulP family sulfate permease
MESTLKSKTTITSDLIAGLTTSIPSIPDAMASGVLAGVSPIYGLYGLMIGTPIAALFTGSAFMSVVTTSAMAITIGTPLGGYQGQDQIAALVTIALVIGVVQLLAGLLRLGFLVRFVSNAVMTGFLSGLGVLIVLSQLGDLTGYDSDFSNKVRQSVDLLRNITEVDLPTTLVGLTAIALIVILDRTRLRRFSMLLGLLIVALLPVYFAWDTVLLVGDTADIPQGLPRPVIPAPLFDLDLITVGIAVAIIGMVQGAGVSLGYPNPDGKYPDVSRDFVGQGVANLAVSLFQGLPVGGSLTGGQCWCKDSAGKHLHRAVRHPGGASLSSCNRGVAHGWSGRDPDYRRGAEHQTAPHSNRLADRSGFAGCDDLYLYRYPGNADPICGFLGRVAEFRDAHLPISREG